jgi:cell division protein FtsL
MNNQSQSSEIKTKIQISKTNSLLSWSFGVFFILCGIGIISASIISGIICIAGGILLIPSAAEIIEKKYKFYLSRNKKILLVFIVVISAPLLAGLTSKTEDKVVSNNDVQNTKTEVTKENTLSKENAQKELDEIISLGKKAGLISSYEFSDKATVVYVGDTWYTQTVSFKKDLMAKIATLKKIIIGYRHFEVRDAYSNEKVAEVAAFSGSLEVYK